jgi:hypothetical protein
MDHNISTPSDEKFQMHVDNDTDDANRLIKSRYLGQRQFRLTSLIFPIILAILLIIGTVLLILTITRRNVCRQQQLEQAEAILGYKPDDHVSQKESKSTLKYNNIFILDENMVTMCKNKNIIMCMSSNIYSFIIKSISLYSKSFTLS